MYILINYVPLVLYKYIRYTIKHAQNQNLKGWNEEEINTCFKKKKKLKYFFLVTVQELFSSQTSVDLLVHAPHFGEQCPCGSVRRHQSCKTKWCITFCWITLWAGSLRGHRSTGRTGRVTSETGRCDHPICGTWVTKARSPACTLLSCRNYVSQSFRLSSHLLIYRLVIVNSSQDKFSSTSMVLSYDIAA